MLNVSKMWDRFVTREQLRRWRAKRKLVSGSKHRGRLCRGTGYCPRRNFDICTILQSSAFFVGKWFAMSSIMRS